MTRFLVTGVYADVIDTPQAYEPGTIEAESAEQAEEFARQMAVEDNGGTWPDDRDGGFALTDVFARPSRELDDVDDAAFEAEAKRRGYTLTRTEGR
jgi:hypothetical protein